MEVCGKMPNMNTSGVPKKYFKGGYHLFLEFVNKVLLPHFEMRIVTFVIDLFLMEILGKFKQINLPTIILEYIRKILTVKDGKNGLGYGFLPKF